MALTPNQKLSILFLLQKGSSVAEVARRLTVPAAAVEAIQSRIRG